MRAELRTSSGFIGLSRFMGRDAPERPGLAERVQEGEQLLSQRRSVQEEIGLQPSAIVFASKDPRPFMKRQNSVGSRRIIRPPAARVFFRPEEIHVVSGVRPVVIPTRRGQIGLPHHRFWNGDERVVPHAQAQRFGAVQTAGIDVHVLTWEEPADRQRVQASERVPLLLTVDGDTVRGRDIGER